MWLGYGGLVPFLVFAAGSTLDPAGLGAASLRALTLYAALILAFVGGVAWGSALAAPDPRRIALSMAPFAVAWLGAVMAAPWSLWILLAGFAAAWLIDRGAANSGALPPWFLTLRRRLSGVVVTVLAIAALNGAP